MNPSDLPAWGWLCIAAFVSFITFITYAGAENSDSTIGKIVAWLFGVIATFFWLVGIVRMVKWIWNG